jgi:hypothetical protein
MLIGLAACGSPGTDASTDPVDTDPDTQVETVPGDSDDTPIDTDPADTDVETDAPVDTDPADTDVETDPPVDTDPADTELPADSDTLFDSDPPDPCMSWPSQVEVGTGERAFVPITPGQDVEMTFGPQGGWHFWTAVRANHTPQFVQLVIDVTHLASGEVVAHTDMIIALLPDPPATQPGQWSCTGIFTGLFAILDTSALDPASTPPTALCGEDLSLSLQLFTTAGDPIGSDQVQFVGQPDPVDGPYCP